jgi:sigma-B regulation protein RsbU (phosphoserine phosphatase)
MAERAFALTVPADARYLKVVRAFFQPVLEDCFGDQAGMMVLALDESCSNIVKHRVRAGEGAVIAVHVSVDEARMRIRLGDFCAAEDVAKIRPRDLGDVRPGGLGTHFVDSIMDSVRYEPEAGQPGRVALVMDKALPGRKTEDADHV